MDITRVKNILNAVCDQTAFSLDIIDKAKFVQRKDSLFNLRNDYITFLPNNTIIGFISLGVVKKKFFEIMGKYGWEHDRLSCGEFVIRKKSKYYEGYLKSKLKDELDYGYSSGYRLNVKRVS